MEGRNSFSTRISQSQRRVCTRHFDRCLLNLGSLNKTDFRTYDVNPTYPLLCTHLINNSVQYFSHFMYRVSIIMSLLRCEVLTQIYHFEVALLAFFLIFNSFFLSFAHPPWEKWSRAHCAQGQICIFVCAFLDKIGIINPQYIGMDV